MITEWINENEETYREKAKQHIGSAVASPSRVIDVARELMAEDYPYLVDVQKAEGVMGHRRIAIAAAPVIDQGFDLVSDGETLLHGWPPMEGSREPWQGMGVYDFDVVPFCFKHWLFLQATAFKLGAKEEVEVTVEQMRSMLQDKLDAEVKAHAR